MKNCQNKQACISKVIKEEKTIAPPKLYDLTTLQRDANRLFGFTAKSEIRPEVTAGPIDLNFKAEKVDEAYNSSFLESEDELFFVLLFFINHDIIKAIIS